MEMLISYKNSKLKFLQICRLSSGIRYILKKEVFLLCAFKRQATEFPWKFSIFFFIIIAYSI